MARINKTRFALLGWLSKGQALSGYDLQTLSNRLANLYWSESYAQIYPILKQLEKEGMVTSALDKKSGARNRRAYKITRQGKAVLVEWLLKPAELPKYREELLLKLGFGQHLKKTDIIAMLQDYKLDLQEIKRHLTKMQTHIREKATTSAQKYLAMTHRHSELTLDAKLKWCDECIKLLK